MSEWRSDYERRLASPSWAGLRHSVIRAQRGLCAGCGLRRSRLELHHLHYRTLGQERPEDVVALCRWCHIVWDEERAKEGRSRADSALYNARVEGFARSLGYDTEGSVDWDSVEDRYERWIDSRGY